MNKDYQKFYHLLQDYINCQVVTKPIIIKGGHVIFYVRLISSDIMPVAVYKPTVNKNCYIIRNRR